MRAHCRVELTVVDCALGRKRGIGGIVKCGSWLFTRDIPDFPDCVVEGRNLLEALDGTRKRLAVRLAEMVAQNLPLPQESLLDEIS